MRLILIIFIFCLTACKTSISPDDYFPLHRGVAWEYQVTEDLTDSIKTRQFFIENLGPVLLGHEYEGRPVILRRTSDGTWYYILAEKDGFYRIAKRTLVETKPRFDKSKRKILPAKSELVIGQSWAAETVTYALHSIPSYNVPDPAGKRIHMAYEIASITDTVDVPAGKFENCIRIEGEETVKLYVDPKLGYQYIHIKHTEWYAPGVGLVKLVREEPLDVEMFKGGRIQFELVNFNS